MLRKKLLTMIAAAALFAAPAAAVDAENIRIGVSGSSIAFTPFHVAQQSGYFKKYGLDVEIVSISRATIVVQAPLGGHIEFGLLRQAPVPGAGPGAGPAMIGQ